MRTPATVSAALLQKSKPHKKQYISSTHRTLERRKRYGYVAPEVPVETKDWMTTFLLCLFCGGLGVHRYYVGKIGTGILYTLTAGLFGIGYLVDFIKILCGKFTDKDGNLIQREKK